MSGENVAGKSKKPPAEATGAGERDYGALALHKKEEAPCVRHHGEPTPVAVTLQRKTGVESGDRLRRRRSDVAGARADDLVVGRLLEHVRAPSDRPGSTANVGVNISRGTPHSSITTPA